MRTLIGGTISQPFFDLLPGASVLWSVDRRELEARGRMDCEAGGGGLPIAVVSLLSPFGGNDPRPDFSFVCSLPGAIMDVLTPDTAEPFAGERMVRVSGTFPLTLLMSDVDMRRSGALILGRKASVSLTFSGISLDAALGAVPFRRSVATFIPPSLSLGRLIDPLRLSGFGYASKKIPAGRPSGLWIKRPEEADPPNGFAAFEKYSMSSNANGEAGRG